MSDPMTNCVSCGGSGRAHGEISCAHCGGRGLVVDPVRKLMQDATDRNSGIVFRRSSRGSTQPLPQALRFPALILSGLVGFVTYSAFKPDPLAWVAALFAFAATMIGIKLVHNIVNRPFQWIFLLGLLYGIDQFLFAGGVFQWITHDGLSFVTELLQD